MTVAHRDALDDVAKSAHMAVVPYHSSARVLRDRFAPHAIAAKVGILTAGTSDVAVADECRMVVAPDEPKLATVVATACCFRGGDRDRGDAGNWC